MSRPVTQSATFCATLVDEWVNVGVTSAFIAPGSRSTPVALALLAHADMAVHLFHDERSASFAAIGHGLATGTPGVILCSSGTAGTHFHAAVVEADLSAVPLLVVTADRPPELVGVGAPQTICQTNLYGPVVRGFFEPGVPEDTHLSHWRPLAADSAALALGHGDKPGPVHLNLGFRDPLDGRPGPLPPSIPQPEAPVATEATPAELDQIVDLIDGRHGIVVAGAGLSNPTAVADLAAQLDWPLLADQRSGCSAAPDAILHADLIARTPEFTDLHQPQVVLRFGEQQASKALNNWLANGEAVVIAATPHRRTIDPDRIAAFIVPEARLATAIAARAPKAKPADVAAWRSAQHGASNSITRFVAANPESEIAVARSVLESSPSDAAIVLSSSMPIRQVEWFAGNAGDRSVHSNRGANGIDGVIATAIGVATTGSPTYCFIGDVAFLHDATSLTALAQRSITLTIVVVNNDGGGIFSHLPQATNLTPDQFEFLFGTPHGTDLTALVRAHGIVCEPWSPAAVANGGGVRVLIAPSDRAAALSQQGTLVASATAAIAATIDR